MASLDDVDAELLETEEAIQRIEEGTQPAFPQKKSPTTGGFCWSVFFGGETKNLKKNMFFFGGGVLEFI